MNELEAGRELDALVAEKVMGWKKLNDTGLSWRSPDEGFSNLPYFSTDISAAWQVVEKMRETRWIEVHSTIDGEWAAFYTPIGTTDMNQAIHEYAKASTAPLAICRAALKAKGVE